MKHRRDSYPCPGSALRRRDSTSENSAFKRPQFVYPHCRSAERLLAKSRVPVSIRGSGFEV